MKGNLVVAGLVILLATSFYPMLSRTAGAADITLTGDQVITDAQAYSGDTITVKDGNLTIASGGSITARSVTFIMDSTVNGRYHIEVQAGGTLTASGCTVKSTSNTYRYQMWFRSDSRVTMDNCAITDCGFGASAANAGLAVYIESNSTQITNSTIKNGYIGVLVDTAASPFIYKNTISNNEGCGVATTGGSKPVIDRNTITNNAVTLQHGIWNINADPVISNNTISGHKLASSWAIRNQGAAGQPSGSIISNTITGNSMGIYLVSGSAIVSGNTISNNVLASDPANTGYGIADSTNSQINNNIITGNSYGILMVGAALSTYTGCYIANNTVCGIGGDAGTAGFGGIFVNCTLSGNKKDVQFNNLLGGAGGGICTFINTVYDNKSMEILDNEVQLILKWFVHVKVTTESTGAIVDAASVKCRDRLGGTQLLVLSGSDGWSPWMILQEKTIGNKSEYNVTLAPYNISVAKGTGYNWTVVKLDQSYEFTFPLDDIVPWIKVDSPQDNDVVNRTSVEFSGTVETPFVAVAVGGVAASVRDDGTWTAKVPLAVEGKNVITASAQDRGRNWANQTVTVIRDTTAPVITLTAPEDNSLTNKTMVTVAGKVNDISGRTYVNGAEVPVAADGTFSTQVPIDEGQNTIKIESSDAVWNTASVSVRVERDTSAPMLLVSEPGDGFATNASSVTVKGQTDASASVTVNGKAVPLTGERFTSTVALEEGDNLIYVAASDAAGNVRLVMLRVVKDSTPPRLNVTFPTDGLVVKDPLVTVRGSTEEGALVKVNGGGVSFDGRSFSAEVRLTTEGENTIVIDAYDPLKNHVQLVFKVYLDTMAPDLKITAPVPISNFLTNQAQIDIRGRTEPGATVTIDGEPVTVDQNGLFSAKLPLPSDGTYTFDIITTDIAGNFNEEFVTVVKDTVARYNISSPVDRLKTKLKTLSVTGDVEVGSTVSVNGNSVSVRPDGTFIAEVILSDGENTILIQVRDKAGNQASKELTVIKTKPAPPPSSVVPGFEALLAVAAVAVVAAAWRARRKP
jgi:parallel beta-helix repeat protein